MVYEDLFVLESKDQRQLINMATRSTSVRPTKSKAVYGAGIGSLIFGLLSLSYGVILFQYPPVWPYVYCAILSGIIFVGGGMCLIISSSNFDKPKYVTLTIVVGTVVSSTAIATAVFAAVAVADASSPCACELPSSIRTNVNPIRITNCSNCASTAHLCLYVALAIQSLFHFVLSLSITLYSFKQYGRRNEVPVYHTQ